jgi:hypothetical protein
MLSQWLVNRFSTGRSSFWGKTAALPVMMMVEAEGSALYFPTCSRRVIGLAIDFNAQLIVFIAIEEKYAETP